MSAAESANLAQLASGQALPDVTIPITLQRLVMEAGANRDLSLIHLDSEYLTAAAIGIAREMGDHMLKRRPVDAAGATEFATKLMLAGVETLAKSEH